MPTIVKVAGLMLEREVFTTKEKPHMNKKVFAIVSVLLAAMIVVTSVAANGGGHEPVTLCHNPGPNQVTITVDNSSVVQAHLRHGDYLGVCRPWDVETEPPPATDTPPTATPPTPVTPTPVTPTDTPPTEVTPTKEATPTDEATPTGVPTTGPTAVHEEPKSPPPPPASGLDFNWIDGSAGMLLGAGKFEAYELGGGGYWFCDSESGWQWCKGMEMQTSFDASWVLVSFTPTGGERIWLLVDNDVKCSTAGGQNVLPRHTCGQTARGQWPTIEVALPGEGALLVNQ